VTNPHLPLLERQLAGLRRARPDLAAATAVEEDLLRETLGGARPPEVRPPILPWPRVLEKVRAGVPLLHDEPLFLDLHYAADLFGRLVDAVERRRDPALAERTAPIVAAATQGRLDPNQLFTEAFVQHGDHLAQLALDAGADPDALTTLATLAVGPLLRGYAERVQPILERLEEPRPDTETWHRGYCPACGGWPLLGELRGVELRLFLRCAACGLGWRWRRIACPYCGTEDHAQLHTLQVEGDRRFRAQTCDRCRGYLKVGNAFEPPPAELLVLDDLASISLDVAAVEAGFLRPTGTGFRLELATPETEADELAFID
jgi:FdhE protein